MARFDRFMLLSLTFCCFVAADELRFTACVPSLLSQQWELVPSTTNALLVAFVQGSQCITAAGSSNNSGAVGTTTCNKSDPKQQWLYNTTVKNALPMGSRGFVLSQANETFCPVGNSSIGCCLTNNGPPVALWGCCPYKPSACANQRVSWYDEGNGKGTLQNQNQCVSAGPWAPIVTFEKLGAIDFKSYESTPFMFGGKLMLMETITLTYPGHISHWKPEFKDCSSYYRVRDLKTGLILRNLTESCDHSFGSAFVDVLPNGTEVLWIFGPAWYRPVTALAMGDDRLGWGGKCSDGRNCTIDSFHTMDPTLQTWTLATAISPGRSTWNVNVALGKPPASGGRMYVMAVEQQPLPGAPAGSGWTTYFYTNEKSSSDDHDLSTGWRKIPINSEGQGSYVIGGPGTHGACPTIRWIPDEDGASSSGGFYYVISGGLSVYLDRSTNLSRWEPANRERAGGVILQASAADVEVCSEYIGFKPTAAEQQLLNQVNSSVQAWDADVSDVDLWELPDGTTIFCYLFGNQGSTIFSALGRYSGSMASWFRMHFNDLRTPTNFFV